MSRNIVFRVGDDLLVRVDRRRELIAARAGCNVNVTRSDVVRDLLQRALDEAERSERMEPQAA